MAHTDIPPPRGTTATLELAHKGNQWISKRSRDVAGKFELHRNQGDITEKRNDRFVQIMYKPEISREIHLEFSK